MRSNLIRSRGTPRWVEFNTPSGPKKFQRRSDWTKVYIPEWELAPIYQGGGLDPSSQEMLEINVQDYQAHFIVEVTKRIYMCSCGSPAVFTGSKGYQDGATPDGLRLVCLSRHGRIKQCHDDGVR